jgi:hypothetical protein
MELMRMGRRGCGNGIWMRTVDWRGRMEEGKDG